ncbi:MAG TPA: histidine kinase [Sphingomicrobium sp.]|nr:histidine kinase [Sphingomicrobium sp.]
MFMTPAPVVRSRFEDWPLAVKSILGFWFFYFLTVVARAVLGHDWATVLENKAVTISVGVVLTFGVYGAIRLFADEAGLRRQALIAGIFSFVAAAALAGFLIAADRYEDKPHDEFQYVSKEGYQVTEVGDETRIERPNASPLVVSYPNVSELPVYEQFRIAADAMVVWLFFFAAWSAYYLATQAQAQVLKAQRRAAEAEGAAQSAQLQALRYQINPHFLFNTLNSLSSLVMTGRSDRAEAMLLALSTFFRTSLSLDPAANVTLAEEIDLQRLYLDIEKARFPDRLHVEIDVPQELEQARLPALLLQPIVENAIKYGVSKSRKAVVLRIEARHLDDHRMVLEISNRLKNGGREQLPAATHEGTGLGLANVCQRLDARFGSRATCRFGAMTGGGFKVSITMPVDVNG